MTSADLITIAEAARILQVHHQTVRNLIKNGRLAVAEDMRYTRKGRYRLSRIAVEQLRGAK